MMSTIRIDQQDGYHAANPENQLQRYAPKPSCVFLHSWPNYEKGASSQMCVKLLGFKGYKKFMGNYWTKNVRLWTDQLWKPD